MDLYAVLGLQQGASVAEIKRAYRRLARRYHPGINPGDRTAEAMFHRIAEAYETLVDPARRQEYDTAGGAAAHPGATARSFEFAGFDFSVTVQGAQAATFSELFADVLHPGPAGDRGQPEAGADIHAVLTVPFLEALRGTERQVVVTRHEQCAACSGTGHVRTAEGRCPQCHASGSVRWARGHMVFSKTCGACAGSGRLRQQRCGACGAHGRVVRSEAVQVSIPPGTLDGARVRVQERGHAGRHGGRTGDLDVSVHVTPHHLFRREGDDLVVDVPVAIHEAVLGAKIEVPGLEGPLGVRIPPGTQSGQRFRLSQRGFLGSTGEHGDMLVEVRVVLPARVDERSKELMREFGRLNGDDVRKDLKA